MIFGKPVDMLVKGYRYLSLLIVPAAIFCSGVMLSCKPSNDAAPAVSEAEPEVAREVTFSVPAVTCASCLMSIRKEVINEPGVISMGGDADAKTVLVRLSAEAPEGEKTLLEAIKRAGFEASLVEE